MKLNRIVITFLMGIILVSCALGNIGSSQATQTPVILATPTATPVSPAPETQVRLWVDDSVPAQMKTDLHLPGDVRLADSEAASDLKLGATQASDAPIYWFYAVVAPFSTIPDNVTLDEIQQTFQGKGNTTFNGKPLMVSSSTEAALTTLWGAPSSQGVTVVDDDQLVTEAWANQPSWAIVPFEDLVPRWKVLHVNGLDLFDRHTDLSQYPLVVHFGLSGDSQVVAAFNKMTVGASALPATNFDPNKMTILLMTGTTALTRWTAIKMAQNGVLYPGEDIKATLQNADFTHTSDEVSFFDKCPTPDPAAVIMLFCSDPSYIQLFQDVHINIIEFSGNHMADYGMQPFVDTMATFKKLGIPYYASGGNADEARQPIMFEHDGNKIAMLGCNDAGPDYVWATDTTPGAAKCDFDWMKGEVESLKQQGYIVIVTLQAVETDANVPPPTVRLDFLKAALGGPDIIQGSQAHRPQGFEFAGNTFIHYGIGNLFFDQMDNPVDGQVVTGQRNEFYDRHVFYDGKYISTELLTGMLYDYSQPHLMTPDERTAFLQEIFGVSFSYFQQ
jgi:poly-gamma-glutamate synthesis protein (capsule biosynthesis protein)